MTDTLQGVEHIREVSSTEFVVLVTIAEAGEHTQLSEFRQNIPTVARMSFYTAIDGLDSKGFIDIRRSDTDNRAKEARVTDDGLALLQDVARDLSGVLHE